MTRSLFIALIVVIAIVALIVIDIAVAIGLKRQQTFTMKFIRLLKATKKAKQS